MVIKDILQCVVQCWYLLSFERVQDGEVSRVLQCEDDDFASVVKAWSSSYK